MLILATLFAFACTGIAMALPVGNEAGKGKEVLQQESAHYMLESSLKRQPGGASLPPFSPSLNHRNRFPVTPVSSSSQHTPLGSAVATVSHGTGSKQVLSPALPNAGQMPPPTFSMDDIQGIDWDSPLGTSTTSASASASNDALFRTFTTSSHDNNLIKQSKGHHNGKPSTKDKDVNLFDHHSLSLHDPGRSKDGPTTSHKESDSTGIEIVDSENNSAPSLHTVNDEKPGKAKTPKWILRRRERHRLYYANKRSAFTAKQVENFNAVRRQKYHEKKEKTKKAY